MNIVHYLRENHVPVVAITSEGSNYLREQVDTVLTMTTMEALYNKIATFSTEESLQYLLNVLYSCYFAKDLMRITEIIKLKVLDYWRQEEHIQIPFMNNIYI